MKLGVAERMAACDGWENGDGETARTQAYIVAVEETIVAQGGDEEDEDAPPARRVRRGRRAA